MNKKFLVVFENGRQAQSKAEQYMFDECKKIDRRVVDANDFAEFMKSVDELPTRAAEEYPRCKAQSVRPYEHGISDVIYGDWSIQVGNNSCCYLRLKVFYI